MLIRSPSAIDLVADPGRPAADVDVQGLDAAHAGLAHPAGDHRGVAGLAAAGGEDAVGGDHAFQVVRVRLLADEDDLLAPAAAATAVGESKTAPPTAAPGEARHPLASRCARRRRRTAGTSAAPAARRSPGSAPRPS